MNRSYLFLVLFCILSVFNTYGQKGPELGLWLGTSTYYGDLKPTLNLQDLGLAGGLNFRYNFNDRISYKTSLNYMRLRADDSKSANNFQLNRNLSFFSDIYDMSHQMEFNFLPYVHGSDDKFYTPYLFGGISGLFYNPKTRLDFDQDGTEEVYTLRQFGTEGQAFGNEYGRFTLALNYGFGVKFDINVDWSINIEVMGRSTFTDYIDDVSTTYPDFNELGLLRGDIAVALSNRTNPGLDQIITGDQRGNSRDRDYYYTFSVSIMRYFGQLQCPKIGKPRQRKPKND